MAIETLHEQLTLIERFCTIYQRAWDAGQGWVCDILEQKLREHFCYPCSQPSWEPPKGGDLEEIPF